MFVVFALAASRLRCDSTPDFSAPTCPCFSLLTLCFSFFTFFSPQVTVFHFLEDSDSDDRKRVDCIGASHLKHSDSVGSTGAELFGDAGVCCQERLWFLKHEWLLD